MVAREFGVITEFMNFYLINNTEWAVPEDFLNELLGWIYAELPEHQADLAREVGVVIADHDQMVDLNEKFRGKKGATDVLSFAGSGPFLGDVVLCRPVLFEQAKAHELAPEEELAYLLLHGILHLLGYDHETSESDAQKMFAIQDKIFEVLQDQDIVKSLQRFS